MNVCSWGLLRRESRLMLCPSFAVQAGLLLCQQQAAAAVAPYGPCMPQIRYLFTQLINGILNRFIFESLTFCWPASTCSFRVVSFKRTKDQKVGAYSSLTDILHAKQ